MEAKKLIVSLLIVSFILHIAFATEDFEEKSETKPDEKESISDLDTKSETKLDESDPETKSESKKPEQEDTESKKGEEEDSDSNKPEKEDSDSKKLEKEDSDSDSNSKKDEEEDSESKKLEKEESDSNKAEEDDSESKKLENVGPESKNSTSPKLSPQLTQCLQKCSGPEPAACCKQCVETEFQALNDPSKTQNVIGQAGRSLNSAFCIFGCTEANINFFLDGADNLTQKCTKFCMDDLSNADKTPLPKDAFPDIPKDIIGDDAGHAGHQHMKN